MDLLSTLPGFPTKSYTHILPSLERKHITTVDLITLDTLDLAKRAHVPPADVRRLCADVVEALHRDLGFEPKPKERDEQETVDSSRSTQDDERLVPGRANRLDLSQWTTISTLDPALDDLLGGGIPTGYLTEVTGESGSGKTQFLLNLLLAAQLPQPQGIGRKAIYISTEAPLSTPRLSQLLETHPYLSTLPADTKPSLANVLSITAIDLETQDHILNYQVPVAISRYNVGLVVIDSIAANVRAEHTSNSMLGLSTRSGELAKLGQLLRNLAANHDIAVVVANQVSDRFDSFDGHQGRPYRPGQGQNLTTAVRDRDRDSGGGRSPLPKTRVEADTLPSSSPAPSPPFAEDESFDGAYIIGHPVRNETLSLAHQERFFTGWGDTFTTGQAESQKTPALGFVWSTQIACRIALKKDDEVAVPMPDVSRTGVPASTPSSQAPSKTTSGSETQTPMSKRQTETDIGASSTNEAESHRSIKREKHPPPPPPLLSQPADHVTKRRMKLVFAPWTSGMVVSTDHSPSASTSDEIEFEIWKGGIRSIQRQIDL